MPITPKFVLLTWLILILACFSLSASERESTLKNTAYQAELLPGDGSSVYFAFGRVSNDSYSDALGAYLSRYYDVPDSTLHVIPAYWITYDFGIDFRLQPQLNLHTDLTFYRLTYSLKERGVWDTPLWHFEFEGTERVTERIAIPSLGLKYTLISIPGLALHAQGDVGYPIVMSTPGGLGTVGLEDFDYRTRGPKIGISAGAIIGDKRLSLGANVGRVYIPMQIHNAFRKSNENFGGYKWSIVARVRL